MQNQSEREKLVKEYDDLMKKEINREDLIKKYDDLIKKEKEAREAGDYSIIGELHMQIHNIGEKIRRCESAGKENIVHGIKVKEKTN